MSGAQSLRTDARAGFELTSFEEVRATPSTSLLRLTGRWLGTTRPPAAPALIIDAAGRRERLAPLAGPPAAPGAVWRAGYAIAPDTLATPGVTLALDTGDGKLSLPLPARVRAPSVATQRTGAVAGPQPVRSGSVISIKLSEEDRREREKAERLTRELERAHRELERLRQLEERLLKSEAALAAAEEQIETLRGQLRNARSHAAQLGARGGREQSR
jgi:hypothetical protein